MEKLFEQSEKLKRYLIIFATTLLVTTDAVMADRKPECTKTPDYYTSNSADINCRQPELPELTAGIINLEDAVVNNQFRPIDHYNGGAIMEVLRTNDIDGDSISLYLAGTTFHSSGSLSGPGAIVHGLKPGDYFIFNDKLCEVVAYLPYFNNDIRYLGLLDYYMRHVDANFAIATSRDESGDSKLGIEANCES